jgi:hypothetical protein
VVSLHSRVIPGVDDDGDIKGYRAQGARVAAVLLIDPMFTLSHAELRAIARQYRVPALVPNSVDPADYATPIAEAVAAGKLGRDVDDLWADFDRGDGGTVDDD